MREPSPTRIVESHDIVEAMMRGEIDPRCDRAQRAMRVATQFPIETAEPRQERSNLFSRSAPVSSPPRRPERRRKMDADDPIIQLVFGSLAPQAERAIDFIQTPLGRKMGVGAAVALGTALIVG